MIDRAREFEQTKQGFSQILTFQNFQASSLNS